jgi:RNA polymerase sigma-70 factor (ECF subfamily)
MSICLRYSGSREEAKEILNNGFFKVFTKMESFDSPQSFKACLRKTMINMAINFYRQEIFRDCFEIFKEKEQANYDQIVISGLSHDKLVSLIPRLSPCHRIIFSLYAIDGYTHEEISDQLQISLDASKSYLTCARNKLRELLSKISPGKHDRITR